MLYVNIISVKINFMKKYAALNMEEYRAYHNAGTPLKSYPEI